MNAPKIKVATATERIVSQVSVKRDSTGDT
jgi:hypothetical protein